MTTEYRYAVACCILLWCQPALVSTYNQRKSLYTCHAYSEARYAAIMRAMIPGSIYSLREFAFYKLANSFIEADVDDADISKIDEELWIKSILQMAATKVLPSKVRELHKLSRKEVVSLFEKLAECSPHGLSPITRREFEDDYHEEFDKAACQDRFATKGGRGEFVHEYLDPSLLVQLVLGKSPRLARRWVQALMEHPNSIDSPWQCIVGFDEYQPGDKFSYEKAKAVMCVYFNMAELDCISQGSTWFCPVAVRINEIDKVQGGWSHAFACYLHRMFLGEHGAQTVGIAFSYQNRDYVVFAVLGHLLSDGDGLRKATGWKGASSLRPSLLHGNILKKDSDLATRAPGFVEISCTDRALPIATTSAEFEDSAELVEEAFNQYSNRDINKTMYEKIQKTESLNYLPGGLAYDRRLRNKVEWFDALTFDWVHTFLQEGVMSVELLLRVQASNRKGMADKLKAFLHGPWNFPKALESKGHNLWRIFSEKRLDEHGEVDRIRASASELLGLYSLARHFFATEVDDPSPENESKFESFESCCQLLDHILATKKELVPMSADHLFVKIEHFMTKHVSCYGNRYLRPKHCWLWGIAERWRRSTVNRVWDCFIIERLHLRVKQIGAKLKSLVRIERTLLSGLLNEQLCALETLEGHSCMLDQTPMRVDSLPGTCFGTCMQVHCMMLSVDDVVFRNDDAGLLRACVFEDEELYGVVEMWAHIDDVTPNASRWQSQTGQFRLYRASELDQAAGLTNTRSQKYYGGLVRATLVL